MLYHTRVMGSDEIGPESILVVFDTAHSSTADLCSVYMQVSTWCSSHNISFFKPTIWNEFHTGYIKSLWRIEDLEDRLFFKLTWADKINLMM